MIPGVSIIVPVFNVERYLGQCLESLRKQTLSNIEIICVEDASTDGSGFVLESVAKLDARIVVLKHSSNRGLSAARNTGFRAARAPWILFIDSDDLVSCRLCERTLAAAKNFGADAVFYGYGVFRDGRPCPPEPALTAAHVADRQTLLRRPAFAWTKLIRSDLMRAGQIEFPEGLCFEDTSVHWRLVLESKRPVFLDEPLVWYRQRKGSITYRSDWSRADGIKTWELIGDYLRATGRWEDWKLIFLIRQLANLAQLHAYFAVANPVLTQRVREETRARMTPEHWEAVLDGKGLLRWQRDYLVSCGPPTGASSSNAPLLPVLRHHLRDSLRCSWHRVRGWRAA